VIIGERDDFCSLAALGGPDREAPFFAPVKEASRKASSSCNFPRRVTPRPVRARCLPACPLSPTVGSGGGRSGTAGISWAVPPLCPCPQDPQNSVEYGACVLPRPATTVGTPLRTQHRFDQLPLGIAEFPSASQTFLLLVLERAENS
jgi:hypothetical protein